MAIALQYTTRGSEEWAREVVARARLNLIRKNKIAAGTLYKSVSYTIDKRTLEIDFYYEDYGEFVESGRKPYPGRGVKPDGPFFNSILKWAKIKGLPQFRDKKGRYISNDSRAFLLARSINKKGIKPYPFFTDAIEEEVSKLYPALEDDITTTIEDSIEI